VRNVLDNALRYAGPDAPVELSVQFDRLHQRASIEVADRGPGMSEEELAHAGQRFWRGGRGRSSGDGAGLGLSIVDAIMRRHGGAVTLQARDPDGLRVLLELPTTGQDPAS
ncbi:MAG TPA: sensor histidine kinase, partial [Candidatus Luteimonas excrementigallinarum]|nr:sensor histidine kinase [Candidatus Luteimonas excrementigallinarum]